MTGPDGPWELVLAVAICVLFAIFLAAFELYRTFGKWLGPHWGNRYVLLIFAVNAATASALYLVLRKSLTVPSTWLLPVITGATFPTLLRTRFVFSRHLDQKGKEIEGFSSLSPNGTTSCSKPASVRSMIGLPWTA
jgi:hypothetical protein